VKVQDQKSEPWGSGERGVKPVYPAAHRMARNTGVTVFTTCRTSQRVQLTSNYSETR